MWLVVRTIHGLQRHSLGEGFTETATRATRYHGLQLREIGNHRRERLVRLFLHADEKPHLLPVVVLARLVHENEINTAEGGGRSPANLAVGAWSFILQHTLDGVNAHVLHALAVR